MKLLFNDMFSWGKPTNFKDKILSGQKIHDLRHDFRETWKQGMDIEFYGVDKNYNQYKILSGKCYSIQQLWIHPKEELIFLKIPSYDKIIKNSWVTLYPSEVAENDGFDTAQDLFRFYKSGIKSSIKLKVIHWTNFEYSFNTKINNYEFTK